jgi:hypothetical protein
LRVCVTGVMYTEASEGLQTMLTTRHPVDFPYTRAELEALFRYANEHDVEQGGRYDARSAAVNIWSHHWQHPATHRDSDILGSFYFDWGDHPRLWAIEADEGFTLDDLMQELGRFELQALGSVKHGDVPRRPPP